MRLLKKNKFQEGGVVSTECPESTLNPQLDVSNREQATANPDIGYNPTGGTQENACGNCALFDVSQRMQQCMQEGGETAGYCWTNQFKCEASAICNKWEQGGPITDDQMSYEMGSRYQEEPQAEPSVEEPQVIEPVTPELQTYRMGGAVLPRARTGWTGSTDWSGKDASFRNFVNDNQYNPYTRAPRPQFIPRTAGSSWGPFTGMITAGVDAIRGVEREARKDSIPREEYQRHKIRFNEGHDPKDYAWHPDQRFNDQGPNLIKKEDLTNLYKEHSYLKTGIGPQGMKYADLIPRASADPNRPAAGTYGYGQFTDIENNPELAKFFENFTNPTYRVNGQNTTTPLFNRVSQVKTTADKSSGGLCYDKEGNQTACGSEEDVTSNTQPHPNTAGMNPKKQGGSLYANHLAPFLPKAQDSNTENYTQGGWQTGIDPNTFIENTHPTSVRYQPSTQFTDLFQEDVKYRPTTGGQKGIVLSTGQAEKIRNERGYVKNTQDYLKQLLGNKEYYTDADLSAVEKHSKGAFTLGGYKQATTNLGWYNQYAGRPKETWNLAGDLETEDIIAGKKDTTNNLIGARHLNNPTLTNTQITNVALGARKYGGSLPIAQDGTGDTPHFGGTISPVTVEAENPWGPYYKYLSQEEKRYLQQNPGINNAIARNIKGKASQGYGIEGNPTFTETATDAAIGSLTGAPDMALEFSGIKPIGRTIGRAWNDPGQLLSDIGQTALNIGAYLPQGEGFRTADQELNQLQTYKNIQENLDWSGAGPALDASVAIPFVGPGARRIKNLHNFLSRVKPKPTPSFSSLPAGVRASEIDLGKKMVDIDMRSKDIDNMLAFYKKEGDLDAVLDLTKQKQLYDKAIKSVEKHGYYENPYFMYGEKGKKGFQINDSQFQKEIDDLINIERESILKDADILVPQGRRQKFDWDLQNKYYGYLDDQLDRIAPQFGPNKLGYPSYAKPEGAYEGLMRNYPLIKESGHSFKIPVHPHDLEGKIAKSFQGERGIMSEAGQYKPLTEKYVIDAKRHMELAEENYLNRMGQIADDQPLWDPLGHGPYDPVSSRVPTQNIRFTEPPALPGNPPNPFFRRPAHPQTEEAAFRQLQYIQSLMADASSKSGSFKRIPLVGKGQIEGVMPLGGNMPHSYSASLRGPVTEQVLNPKHSAMPMPSDLKAAIYSDIAPGQNISVFDTHLGNPQGSIFKGFESESIFPMGLNKYGGENLPKAQYGNYEMPASSTDVALPHIINPFTTIVPEQPTISPALSEEGKRLDYAKKHGHYKENLSEYLTGSENWMNLPVSAKVQATLNEVGADLAHIPKIPWTLQLRPSTNDYNRAGKDWSGRTEALAEGAAAGYAGELFGWGLNHLATKAASGILNAPKYVSKFKNLLQKAPMNQLTTAAANYPPVGISALERLSNISYIVPPAGRPGGGRLVLPDEYAYDIAHGTTGPFPGEKKFLQELRAVGAAGDKESFSAYMANWRGKDIKELEGAISLLKKVEKQAGNLKLTDEQLSKLAQDRLMTRENIPAKIKELETFHAKVKPRAVDGKIPGKNLAERDVEASIREAGARSRATQEEQITDDIGSMFDEFGEGALYTDTELSSSLSASETLFDDLLQTFRNNPALMEKEYIRAIAKEEGQLQVFDDVVAALKSEGPMATSHGRTGRLPDFANLEAPRAFGEGFLPYTELTTPQKRALAEMVSTQTHRPGAAGLTSQQLQAHNEWALKPKGTKAVTAFSTSGDSTPQNIRNLTLAMKRLGQFSKDKHGMPLLEYHGHNPINDMGYATKAEVDPRMLLREQNAAITKLNEFLSEHALKNKINPKYAKKVPYSFLDEKTGGIRYPFISLTRQHGGTSLPQAQDGGYNWWEDYNGAPPSMQDLIAEYSSFPIDYDALFAGEGEPDQSFITNQTEDLNDSAYSVESDYGEGFFEPMRNRQDFRKAYKQEQDIDDPALTGKQRRDIRRDARQGAWEENPNAVGAAPFNRIRQAFDSKPARIATKAAANCICWCSSGLSKK